MSQNVVLTGRQAVESAVTRFFHMCNSHCPGNVAPLLTGDIELVADKEAKGQDAVHAYFVWLWESYPDLTFRVEHILIDGSHSAAEVSYTNGPNGTGTRCFVFNLREDQIRRIRCY